MALHHDGNEARWFRGNGVRDPYSIAADLWRVSLKFQDKKINADERDLRGLRIVRKYRMKADRRTGEPV